VRVVVCNRYAKHARSMVALINEADETTVLRVRFQYRACSRVLSVRSRVIQLARSSEQLNETSLLSVLVLFCFCFCVCDQAECFEAFATALTKHPPPEDQRLPLLNDSWRVVTKVEDPRVYSNCVAAYIGLLIKYYSVRLQVHRCYLDCASEICGSGGGGGGGGVQLAWCVECVLRIEPCELNPPWHTCLCFLYCACYYRCLCAVPVSVRCLLRFCSCIVTSQERELVILLRDCARRMGAAAAAERDAATAADRASGDESKDTDDVGGPDRPKTLPAVAEPGMNKVINLLMSESSQVDFGTIFTSDAFVKILDLFKPEQKAALSKRLLEFFTRTQDPTNDPVVIHMCV